MGGAMKYFSKQLLDHEIFRSMIFWATKFFFEKFVKPPGLPSYIYNVRSLTLTIFANLLDFLHLLVVKKLITSNLTTLYQY